jgi:hypothetical protein
MKLATSRRIRWTTADYFRMAVAGLFRSRWVELIEGEVIRVAAQATPHRAPTAGTAAPSSACTPAPALMITGL